MKPYDVMKIKTFGIIICILLVPLITPINNATPLTITEEKICSITDSLEGKYLFCYVNSSGTYVNLSRYGTWFRPNDFTYASKIFVGYTENATTTIYRTKNGKELDHVEGAHELTIWFFIGFLDYKARKRVSLHGIALISSLNHLVIK